jgi:hypothetical protein
MPKWVRDHLHVRQHRQHARYRENAGQKPRSRRHQCQRYGEVKPGGPERRRRRLGQSIVLGGDDHDEWVGLQLHCTEGAEHADVEDDRRDQHPPPRPDVAPQSAKDAPMDQDVHDQIEKCAEGRDAAKVEKRRKQ